MPSIIGFNHDEMWALLPSLPAWVKGMEVEAALSVLFGASTALKAWPYYKKLYVIYPPPRLAVLHETIFILFFEYDLSGLVPLPCN